MNGYSITMHPTIFLFPYNFYTCRFDTISRLACGDPTELHYQVFWRLLFFMMILYIVNFNLHTHVIAESLNNDDRNYIKLKTVRKFCLFLLITKSAIFVSI